MPETVYAPFCITGEGWFEDRLGKSASEIVKELRKARRMFKEHRSEIDDIIDNVRKIKSMEVDATIKQLGWGSEYEEDIRKLGVSERDLKSLRLFGQTRKSSLVRACNSGSLSSNLATLITKSLSSTKFSSTIFLYKAYAEGHISKCCV